MKLAVAAVCLTLFAITLSCGVPDDLLANKACDSAHPCEPGYACLGKVCVPADEVPDAGPPVYTPPRGLCTSDGWCFDHPVQSNTLNAVDAISSTETLAVGAGGVLLRFNAGTWSRDLSPTTSDLRGIYANSATDAFAVGAAGTLVRLVASTWSTLTSPTVQNLNAVFGVGAKLLAVGDAGTVLIWNASAWSVVVSSSGTTTSALHAGSCFAETLCWMVGQNGTVLRYDGTNYTIGSAGSATLFGVFAASSTDAWAVGENGTIQRFNGSGWSAVASGTTKTLRTVFGTAGKVWAAGDSNTLLFWNGSEWISQNANAGLLALYGLSGSSEQNVWLVGQAGLLRRFDGFGWSVQSEEELDYQIGVYCLARSDVWVFGVFFGLILHWDGARWTFVPSNLSHPGGGGFTRAWGSESNHLFAISRVGKIIHWDGVAWSEDFGGNGQSLSDIWGSGPNDVWAVGNQGTIYRFNGSGWTTLDSPVIQYFRSVTGTSASDVWISGAGGSLLHWNGMELELKTSGVAATLSSIWALGPNDIWAAGDNVLLRYDGSQWIPTSSTHVFTDLWGAASNDVYATTNRGKVLHWNGSSWAQQESGFTGSLEGIHGCDGNDVWAVGPNGTIVRKVP
jgi:hypothetical protein